MTSVAFAEPYEYYECTLPDGHLTNCNQPCAEGQTQRRAKDTAELPPKTPPDQQAESSMADDIRYWIRAMSSWIHGTDARTRQINDALYTQASPNLRSYPYTFHVLRTAGNSAVLSTPRSFDVPAFRLLRVLYPGLDTLNSSNPEFIAAQKKLGEVQSEARLIVLSQPGISCIQWELDRQWLQDHSIDVPDKSRH
jgi:hypothetical protein